MTFNMDTKPYSYCFFATQKHTREKPYIFIPEKDFWFAGKHFKAGIECKQWETRNFGWCFQRQGDKIVLASF